MLIILGKTARSAGRFALSGRLSRQFGGLSKLAGGVSRIEQTTSELASKAGGANAGCH